MWGFLRVRWWWSLPAQEPSVRTHRSVDGRLGGRTVGLMFNPNDHERSTGYLLGKFKASAARTSPCRGNHATASDAFSDLSRSVLRNLGCDYQLASESAGVAHQNSSRLKNFDAASGTSSPTRPSNGGVGGLGGLVEFSKEKVEVIATPPTPPTPPTTPLGELDRPGAGFTMGEGRPCVGLARVRFHRPVRIRTGGPGLDIDCSAGGETLTRERLREIPLGEIAAVARARITAFWAEFDKGRTPGVRDVRPIPAGLSPEVDMRRRGRRGRPDSERAEIAEAYVQCCVEDPIKPMELLAKRTKLDPSQLRGLLHQAKQRGLFVGLGPGRPGGYLTEKARALIPQVSAWERATPAQHQAAVDRESQFRALHDAFHTGHITIEEWRERTGELASRWANS